jgi:hypothetical protein
MQQSGDQFLLGPDYAKSRMVVDPTEYVFDEKAGAMIYGPSIPSVECLHGCPQPRRLRRAARGGRQQHNGCNGQRWLTSEENLVPLLSLAVDSLP